MVVAKTKTVNHFEYLKRNDVQNKYICILVKDKGTRDKLIPYLKGVGIVRGMCGARMQRNFTQKLIVTTTKLLLRE